MSAAWISVNGFYVAFAAYTLSLLLAGAKKERASRAVFIFGFLMHSISQVARGWYLGFFFPNPMFNEITFLPWCLAAVGLVMRILDRDSSLFLQVAGLVLIFSLAALFAPKGILSPFAQSQTVLSPLFFVFEVFSHGCFILGAWFALVYLTKKTNARMFNMLVIWGFVLFSIAQIVGATWSYWGWGSPFSWSERHLGSAALWCYYAAYLHLSFVARWEVRPRAVVAALGAVFVLIFAVTYQLSEMSMHVSQ